MLKLSTRVFSQLSLHDLKLLAILAMTVDHLAAGFPLANFSWYLAMRCIGRITGPIMFFAAVEGYRKTRSFESYLVRLVILGLISQLPFWLFFGYSFKLNVIFTIIFGLLAVDVSHRVKNQAYKMFLMTMIIIISSVTDWNFVGVLMMLVFDRFYGNYNWQFFAYGLVIALQNGFLKHLLTPLMSWSEVGRVIYEPDLLIITEALGLVLPMLLLRLYKGDRGGRGFAGKWLFYAYYPGHLLVLWLIRKCLF